MGEAYKGLTIRIGADDSALQKALSRTNHALRTTDIYLRTVQKGLKFDPSNVKLTASRFTLMKEKVEETSMKLRDMARSYNEMAGRNGGIEALESQFAGLESRISNVKFALDDVTEACAVNNNAFKELGKSIGYSIDDSDAKDIEQYIAELDALIQPAGEVRERFEQLRKTNTRLAASFVDADAEYKKLLDVQAAKKLSIDIEKTKAEMKSLVAETVRLNNEMEFGKVDSGFEKLNRELAIAETASEALETKLEAIDGAMSFDNTNFGLIGERLSTAEEAASILESKVKTLEKQLGLLGKQGIEKPVKGMLELEKETESVSKLFKKAENDLVLIKTREMEIERELSAIDTDIKEGKIELQQGRSQVDALEAELRKLVESEKSANGEVRELGMRLKELKGQHTFIDISNEIYRTQSRIKALNASAKGSERLFRSMRDLGTAMSNTLTVPLEMALTMLVQSADEIDSAYRDMRKTVQGTESQFASLRQEAVRFSQTHPVSADTILEIEAVGGALGLAVSELSDFAQVASNLDIATDMESEDIAEQLGQLNNVLQWGEGDMRRYGDALVRLGNNMPAQESKISEVTSRIASMSRIVDMSTPQVLAWATAVAATGQGAEAAGTALSKTMSNIESAVSKGGDKLKGFAEIAGMSSAEFADTWNSNASAAMQAFIEGLKALDESGGSVDNALTGLGITAVRQKQTLMSLTNTVDVLDDSLKMSQNAWNGVSDQWGQAGDASNEAAKKAEGFSGALQVLKNNAKALADASAEGLTPWLNAVSKTIGKATDAVSKMNPQMKSVAVTTLGLVAAAGPALRLIGQFTTSIEEGKGTLGKYIAKNEKLAQTLTKYVAPGYAAAAAAAILLGTAVYKIIKHEVTLKKATTSLTNAVRGTNKEMRKSKSAITDIADQSKSWNKRILELAQSHNDLAKSIQSSFIEANASERQWNSYAGAIKKGITANRDETGKINEMNYALQKLSEQTGDTYEAVANGGGDGFVIMKNGAEIATSAIYDLIDAQIAQAKASALETQMSGIYQQQAEEASALAEAEKKVALAKAAMNDTEGKSASVHQSEVLAYQQAKAELDQLKAQYDDTSAAADNMQQIVSLLSSVASGTATDMEMLIAGNDVVLRSFDNVSGGVNGFISNIENLGITTDMLASLTPAQLELVAASYDGTKESVIPALQQMGITTKQMAQAVKDGAAEVGTAAENAAGKLKAAGADSKSWGGSIAENWLLGLEGKLKDRKWLSRLFTAAAAAANNLNTGARSKQGLDEHSPSRKARTLAHFWSLGIEEQLEDDAKMIRAAGINAVSSLGDANIANAVSVAASDTLSRANAMTSSQSSALSTLSSEIKRAGIGASTTKVYIDGATVNSSSEIETLFYSMMMELKRLGVMQGAMS